MLRCKTREALEVRRTFGAHCNASRLMRNPIDEGSQGCSKMRRCEARKNRTASVYRNTLSGVVCSATLQMCFFQQPCGRLLNHGLAFSN
jgi:hypothetical protein